MIQFGTDGWRAIIGNDFTLANVRKVAQAYADFLGDKRTIYLGYDRRFRSKDFALACADILTAKGHTVFLSSQFCPTPCIAWMVKARRGGGGMVVTASHNPYEWNGIKFKESFGGAALAATTTAIEERIRNQEAAGDSPPQNPSNPTAKKKRLREFNPMEDYIDELKRLILWNKIRKARLKVAYDPMYGSGAGYLTPILGRSLTQIHAEANPGFGGTNPEPIEANLSELKKMVVRGGFDIGLATDGDADRIGAVDEKGNFVDSHHIFSLILQHLVEVQGRRGDVVKTVTTTHMIDRLASLYHLPLHETPVGFKHICARLLASPHPLMGGEESGGIGVCHHIYERDGLLCGLLLLEIVAIAQQPLSKIVATLRRRVGPLVYRRVDLHLPQDQIQRLMKRLETNGLDRIAAHRVQRLDPKDGFKFYLDGGSWLLIRPSGTEPLLRTYAEAPTLKEVNGLLQAVQKLI